MKRKLNVLEIATVSSRFSVSALCAVLVFFAVKDGKKVGPILDQVYKVTVQSRLTVDNVNRAAIDERRYFENQMPVILGQVQGILGDTHTLLSTANQTLVSLNANQDKVTYSTVQAINSVNEQVTKLGSTTDALNDGIKTFAKSGEDLDAFITSPDLKDTVHNVDTGTAHLSGAAANVEGTAGDFRQDLHDLTHPKPIVTAANWTLKVAHALIGFF